LNESASEYLDEIAERLRTQDNRATANPAFCVQVCERIGPIMEGYGDGSTMFYDREAEQSYYEDDADPERWNHLNSLHGDGELPDHVLSCAYKELWRTVQTCLTEAGCEEHLKLNGHNYRHYDGVRIYAESFYRNPEMQAVRNWLLAGPDGEPADPAGRS